MGLNYSVLLVYAWVLLVLIVLEGVLAADNALVLAIMVKHLPLQTRKKALFYGLLGAFVLRLASLFVISVLVNVWQVQAIGALYLLFISLNHIVKKRLQPAAESHTAEKNEESQTGFWLTVAKVELADLAFAIDSILAGVALAITLPPTFLPEIGNMDGAQFLVVFAGGFIGLVIMRFAANLFVTLLHRKPGLELAAFVIVGWVGVKLGIHTLAHPAVAVIPSAFVHSIEWKVAFYVILVVIALTGWFFSKEVATSINE